MGYPIFWCERWDSNPHGETTRTSNVLVYHSNTLASDLSIITCTPLFVNSFFLKRIRLKEKPGRKARLKITHLLR